MTSSEEADTYVLNRDKVESRRLDAQHEVGVKLRDYVIHPAIMKELPPGARVADVAAGTGAWALHAADILSDGAQVVAYDISSAQFPTTSPANVRFVVADARQPFPLEDHGSFDHVHICAVVAAMRPQDWQIVMRNVVQLLKPTGTLQWTEADWNNLRCLRDRNDAEVMPWRAIPKLLEVFSVRMDDKISESIGRLRQAVVAQFDHVEIDVVSSDRFPEHRASSTREFLGGMLSWAERAEVLPLQELQKLKPEVEAEIDKGAYIRTDGLTFVGMRLKTAGKSG